MTSRGSNSSSSSSFAAVATTSPLRKRRTSVLDEAILDYDAQERTLLINGLENGIKWFLAHQANAFRGWSIVRTEVNSTHASFHLGTHDGLAREIGSEHFAEVARKLPGFSLRLSVHHGVDDATRSSRLVQKCFLEYDIAQGTRSYGRKRIQNVVLASLLMCLIILFLVLLAMFVKHTEHDSSRLDPVWRVLFPGF